MATARGAWRSLLGGRGGRGGAEGTLGPGERGHTARWPGRGAPAACVVRRRGSVECSNACRRAACGSALALLVLSCTSGRAWGGHPPAPHLRAWGQGARGAAPLLPLRHHPLHLRGGEQRGGGARPAHHHRPRHAGTSPLVDARGVCAEWVPGAGCRVPGGIITIASHVFCVCRERAHRGKAICSARASWRDYC